MVESYREAGLTCPMCKAPLREFGERLVCDECQAMLIGLDDFAAAVHELDGNTEAAEVDALEPTDKTCPRCAAPMSTCALKIGRLKLPEYYLHCAAHGVWMPQQTLTAVFARVSYVAHIGRARGRTYGGVSLPPDTGVAYGGMAGAMRSIGSAFGAGVPADAGLAITRYRAPRVHSVFVSAFKERRLGCPSCKETALEYCGDRWACQTCRGVFVETAALASMIAAMTNETWELPPITGKPGERACPICNQAMLVEVHEAATIDHCASHGVWFDETELGSILYSAGVGKPKSVGGWLQQLFHRHGKID